MRRSMISSLAGPLSHESSIRALLPSTPKPDGRYNAPSNDVRTPGGKLSSKRSNSMPKNQARIPHPS